MPTQFVCASSYLLDPLSTFLFQLCVGRASARFIPISSYSCPHLPSHKLTIIVTIWNSANPPQKIKRNVVYFISVTAAPSQTKTQPEPEIEIGMEVEKETETERNRLPCWHLRDNCFDKDTPDQDSFVLFFI